MNRYSRHLSLILLDFHKARSVFCRDGRLMYKRESGYVNLFWGDGNFRFSEFEFSQREAFGSDFLVIVLRGAGGLQGKLQ